MEDIREKIIDEALVRFNEVGLRFTIDELVEVMHISKKTVYKQFGNKAELLRHVIDYVFEGIREKEERIVADESIDLLEKIKLVIVCLPDKYRSIDFRKVYQIKKKYPDVYEHIICKIDNSWENANKLLAEAIEKNLIKEVPVSFIRLMIKGCTEQFIASEEVIETGFSYEEVMENMVSVILDGIRI